MVLARTSSEFASFDWLLSSTKLGRDSAVQQLASEADASCLTLVDAAALILSSAHRQAHVQRFSGLLRTLVLEEILDAHAYFRKRRDFSPLAAAGAKQAKRLESVQRDLAKRLLTFFDTLRFREIEDAYLHSLVDEQGERLLEKSEAEAIIEVFVRYQEVQESAGRYDAAGMLERATQYLSALETTTSALPPRILFLEPELLLPLEASFLLAVSHHCDLQIQEAALLSAAGEGEAKELAYLEVPKELLANRLKRVDRIQFQDEAEPCNPVLWRNKSQREEVERLFCCLRQAEAEKQIRFEDVQIACLDLASYEPLLKSYARQYAIPLSVRKNPQVRDTPLGAFFSSFLNWLQSASCANAFALLQHPMAAALPACGAVELESFFGRQPTLATGLKRSKLLLESLEGRPALQVLQEARPQIQSLKVLIEHSFLFSLLERYTLDDPQFEQTLCTAVVVRLGILEQSYSLGSYAEKRSLQQQARELLQGIATFVCLQGRARNSAEALQSQQLPLRYRDIRALFTSYRCRLSQAASEQAVERSELVQALRAIHRLLAECRQYALAFVGEERSQRDIAFTLQTLDSFLQHAELQHTPVSGAVAVTEFLDLRSNKRSNTVVLGLSSEALQSWNAEDALQSDIEQAQAALQGKQRRTEIAQWLFAKTRIETRRLVYSFHEHAQEEVLTPAAIFIDTAVVAPGSENPFARDSIKTVNTACKRSEGGIQAAATMLRAREHACFSPYDGLIDARLVTAALQDPVAEDALSLSISAAQHYLDTPFQFYLRYLLKLSQAAQSPLDELAKVIGTIVHTSLERFFSTSDYTKDAAVSFAAACRELRGCAERAFESTYFDWDAHPYFRQRKSEVLSGLKPDTAPNEVPGPLRRALDIQEHLLQTIPVQLEHRFQVQGANPLVLSIESPIESRIEKSSELQAEVGPQRWRFYFSGVIDRLDADKDRPAAYIGLWDYKTGTKVPSRPQAQSGSYLQVPLYLEYCRQHFSSLPQVAGILHLKVRHYNESDFNSATYGPRRILFGAGKKPLEDELETALASIRQQLQELLAGACMQTEMSQDASRFSDFAVLLSSDYSTLKRKHKNYLEGRKIQLELAEAGVLPTTSKKSEFFVPRELSTPNQLTEEQAAACELGRPIVLRAGAGSGKTFVLQNRVLKIVESGHPVDSILALTFTKKAAAQMRERIERALRSRLAEPESDQMRMHYERALAELPGMQVSTIHSFCSRVLLMEPELSGVNSEDALLGAAQQRAFLDEAIQLLLVDSRHQEPLRVLMEDYGVHPHELEVMLRDLCTEPEMLDKLEGSLKRLEGTESEVAGVVNVLQAFYQRTREQEAAKFRIWLAQWSEELAGYLEETQGRWKPEKQSCYRSLLSVARGILNAVGSSRESAAIEVYYLHDAEWGAHKGRAGSKDPRAFYTDFVAALNKYQEACPGEESVEQTRRYLGVSAHLCTLASALRSAYQEWKSVAGVYDHNDQIRLAHQLLCQPFPGSAEVLQSRLLARLQTHYRHIMVDEFQDTDLQQWEIIRAIAGCSKVRTLDSADALQGMFLVGDLQQSIYSFRGGDSRVFRLAQRELSEAGGEVLSLRDNYRSHPEIVRFVNVFFKKLFAVDFSNEPDQAAAVVETATRLSPMNARVDNDPSAEQRVQALVFKKSNAKAASKQEDQAAGGGEPESEADTIINFLKALTSSPERYSGLDFDSNEPQVALLCRSWSKVQVLAEALDEAQIEYSLQRSNQFFDLDECKLLYLLLRLLADKHDEIALVGVLRSALIALSDSKLLALSQQLQGNWQSFYDAALDSFPQARYLQQQLVLWQRRGLVQGPSAVLESILSESGLREAFLTAGRTQALANLEHCLDMFFSAERTFEFSRNFRSAVQWYEAMRESAEAVTPIQSSSAKIILSTVHAAKGLEYPMVILPFLAADSSSRPSLLKTAECASALLPGEPTEAAADCFARDTIAGLSFRMDPQEGFLTQKPLAYRWAEYRVLAEERSEERRLFYVACTRAQQYLVLSYQESQSMNKKRKHWASLSELERKQICRDTVRADYWLELLSETDPGNSQLAGLAYRDEELDEQLVLARRYGVAGEGSLS